MKARGDTLLRISGLILGLTVAASLVAASKIPPGTGVLGADVLVASGPTGELAVSPSGPFLSATNLTPAPAQDPPSGTLRVTDQTGSALEVRLRGVPDSPDMDQLLHVRVDAGSLTLYDGMLAGLRDWTSASFTLTPGERQDVTVSTWLDPQDGASWAGRVGTIFLEFDTTPQAAP
jgi:hypothetical protein